mmetsp:Transcript_42695/g.69214  ORF Transcript_42695/g.69214 Transcript_42695/m.69214 type:complete len:98 (+) Transcript_42695:501-794(+)
MYERYCISLFHFLSLLHRYSVCMIASVILTTPHPSLSIDDLSLVHSAFALISRRTSTSYEKHVKRTPFQPRINIVHPVMYVPYGISLFHVPILAALG